MPKRETHPPTEIAEMKGFTQRFYMVVLDLFYRAITVPFLGERWLQILLANHFECSKINVKTIYDQKKQ